MYCTGNAAYFICVYTLYISVFLPVSAYSCLTFLSNKSGHFVFRFDFCTVVVNYTHNGYTLQVDGYYLL